MTRSSDSGVREPLAIESVVSAAIRLSSVFARLLRVAEPGRALDWPSRDRETIRATAEELCSPALPLVLERTALRWQNLLDVACARLPATTRRRPDVLALTRDALSVPEHPHTRALVDFAICAKLRELYGIGRTQDDLERLRQTFQDLEESFEGRQRRRIKKDFGPHACFLVDVMSASGHIWRAPDTESFDAYCAGFAASPFGVAKGHRDFGTGTWPELFGQPPQLASVLRRAYGIPLGVPGLDEALGALQVPFEGGGAPAGSVTLVCGPSGSGRTTLLLVIASALSELGFDARFLAAREAQAALASKLRDLVAVSPSSLWSRWLPTLGARRGRLDVVSVDSAEALRRAVNPGATRTPRAKKALREPEATRQDVVFLDGITFGVDPGSRSGTAVGSAAQRLRESMVRLRDSGVCVFLSCSDDERAAFELDRVSDNVLRLGFHSDPTGRHTTRVLTVDKTRLQSSQRDRHVLNIGEAGGCWVSPSLHAVNRGVAALRPEGPSSAQVFHLPHRVAEARSRGAAAPALREGCHVLVHGPGSSGKASLALSCALAPLAAEGQSERPRRPPARGKRARKATPRTLVVSFLYAEPYYRKLATRLLHGEASAADALTVWTLYPGYIDAETFISSLRKQLASAELVGRPFGSVVLDGVHNLLLEFPMLRADDLLWPTLFRLLRSHGIRAVSTFSSFDLPDGSLGGRSFDVDPNGVSSSRGAFFQTLVSACDYVLEMRRDETPRSRARSHVRVVSSSSEGLRAGARYVWESDALSLVPARPSRRVAP